MGRASDSTAVVVAQSLARCDDVARLVPETVLVAEPRLTRALQRCFLGGIDRLVVDLADCDAAALSALAQLHHDRPQQEILLLQAEEEPGLLRHTSLADLPVAVVRDRSESYGAPLSSRYSRITGPVGDSGAT